VFEDEGETGYFYACDKRNGDDPIVDALHIYDVAEAEKGKKLYLYQIIWSEDGLKAGLFIDNFCHAIFNFDSGRGYCRTNFPSESHEFTETHEWKDECLKWFKLSS